MTELFEDLPEQYWHAAVKDTDDKRHSVANDLNLETLLRTIVRPWRARLPISIAGRIVNPASLPQEVRIVQTSEPKESFAEKHNARMRNSGISDLATDRRMLPFKSGVDHTFDLLFSGPPANTSRYESDLVIEVCRRLPETAKVLAHRSRKGKVTFEVTDEYDAQDLLHATLRGYLRYSVQEDPIAKVAAARSGRADISIEEVGMLIELKYAHGPGDQKRIFEEFSQDLLLYARWPHLKTLVFLIYNSRDLRDADAFRKLSGAHEVSGRKFHVEVVLA
ncbi:hypothetical protein ELI16_14385 [Rhizobium ruizarguesonis]|uniref:PD-(D/E)XK nuclease domain-containing protein n=1 Tax=Rhizobium ruizarguesonis TaxID=2081791 RepID=UPI0010310BDC|nr:hypothetical protein [Rhizobium ruizarguesonis]TAW73040.1 hypothetical protein ELI16_14385 [Rhizobium ruizarguesonis]